MKDLSINHFRCSPEGSVVNWGKRIPLGSNESPPTQTMTENDRALTSGGRSGILVATHLCPVVDMIDADAIPPRYRKRTGPLVHRGSTHVGSINNKYTCQNFKGTYSYEVFGSDRDNLLVFRALPPGTHVQDVSKVLSDHHFSPSVVRMVTLFEHQVATVQFVTSFITDSAFGIFQNMGQSSHIHFKVERAADRPHEAQHHAQYKGCSSNLPNDVQRVTSYIDLTEDLSGDEDEATSTSSSSGSSCHSANERTTYFDKPNLVSDVGTASVVPSHIPGIHLPQEELAGTRRSYSASSSSSKQGTGYHFERRSVSRNHNFGAPSNRPALASSADLVSAPSALVRSQGFTPLVSQRRTDNNTTHQPIQTATVDVPALMTVSMRADTHFFHPVKRHRISSYSMPCREDYQHVEDACVVGETIVIGYGDGPQQISLLRMNKDRSPRKIELNHKPHSRPIRCGRPDTKGTMLVSCLAAACSSGKNVKFFTGGYDKSIRRWTVLDDHGSATSERIAQVTTAPFALASRGRQILIAAGRNFLNIDLNHIMAKPKLAPLSNPVYQIHIHPQAPNITILETSHLDSQVHIFDDRRKCGLDRAPDCHFGYRHEGPLASRYSRGSTHHSYFVKGYPDGYICVWDYRSTQTPVVKIQHRRVEPVVHTIFTKSEIICFGKDTLTFLDHHGNIL
ncbi:hypothetical protein BD779DRAFT_1490354 [Infundibulicybe gibba]|nr:hypothetical protein BD779DRAFT_1490354 [Infundibulicybe gibba]